MNGIRRRTELDILKIICTTIILFHHYQYFLNVKFSRWNFYGGSFYFGYIVEFFFVISGILSVRYEDYIAKRNIDFKHFILKKMVRLLPLVFIAAILYELLDLICFKATGSFWQEANVTGSGTLFNALGISAGWAVPLENNSVNSITWYISVLLLCYVIFYLLNRVAKKIQIEVAYLYIFMVFIGVGGHSYNINVPFINERSVRGYYAFFTGLLLERLLKSEFFRIKRKKVKLLSFLMIILTAFLFVWGVKTDGKYDDIYWLTLIFYPAVIIVFNGIKVEEKLANIFAKISDVSYSVYVIHLLVIIVLYIIASITNRNEFLKNRLAMILFAFAAWIIGGFVHFFIEMPIRRKLDGFIGNSLC